MFKKYQGRRILATLFFCVPALVFALTQPTKTLRIALTDSAYNEMPVNPSLLAEYGRAYLAGVQTATQVAKNYNISIVYQPFFYGDGPLDVLTETPKIQAWNADLVLGPSSSDQMLMLRNYLPSVMVLSSYASDVMLKTLPKNFYSLFLSDDAIMDLLAHYIHEKYPKKNIYIITQVDDKQSVDVSNIFIENYERMAPSTKVVQKKVILDNIDNIDSAKLLAGHENDIVLIFNFSFYDYNMLVEHIAAAMPDKHLIFFSDQDSWGETVSKDSNTKYHLNYESYRIGPIMLARGAPGYKTFEQTYNKIYDKEPDNPVSYISYITVMSAVQALDQYPDPNVSDNMRQKILYSYLLALGHNPNWFKINDFAIYQITPEGEVLITKLPLPQSKNNGDSI